jgi:hypothetical protein
MFMLQNFLAASSYRKILDPPLAPFDTSFTEEIKARREIATAHSYPNVTIYISTLFATPYVLKYKMF